MLAHPILSVAFAIVLTACVAMQISNCGDGPMVLAFIWAWCEISRLPCLVQHRRRGCFSKGQQHRWAWVVTHTHRTCRMASGAPQPCSLHTNKTRLGLRKAALDVSGLRATTFHDPTPPAVSAPVDLKVRAEHQGFWSRAPPRRAGQTVSQPPTTHHPRWFRAEQSQGLC